MNTEQATAYQQAILEAQMGVLKAIKVLAEKDNPSFAEAVKAYAEAFSALRGKPAG